MTDEHDGGPAYPQLSIEAGGRDGHGDLIEPYPTSEGGMSLRDWYAGMALQGMMSNPEICKDAKADFGELNDSAAVLLGEYSKISFMHADAMIRERGK